MGLKHEAKKGTTITANGVKVTVLRGSPLLEVTAPAEIAIALGKEQVLTKRRRPAYNARRLKHRS
jgi:hypothetical protein